MAGEEGDMLRLVLCRQTGKQGGYSVWNSLYGSSNTALPAIECMTVQSIIYLLTIYIHIVDNSKPVKYNMTKGIFETGE